MKTIIIKKYGTDHIALVKDTEANIEINLPVVDVLAEYIQEILEENDRLDNLQGDQYEQIRELEKQVQDLENQLTDAARYGY